ncbi:MAG: response regulator [Bdellovibrionota bacterium]|nr:response regulator [Bdellovibrionota bacterium]
MEKILIVEDNESNLETMRVYCQDTFPGAGIIVTKDGNSAISELSRSKFDLILLDVNIPQGPGVAVLKYIKNTYKNSMNNVVLVSGYLDHSVVNYAKTLGVTKFLDKPFSATELLDCHEGKGSELSLKK